MKKYLLFITVVAVLGSCTAGKVSRADYKKDVLLQTNYGDMVMRLSDLTPLHRDNFGSG